MIFFDFSFLFIFLVLLCSFEVFVFSNIDLALENSSFVIAPSLKRLFNWVNSSVILAANKNFEEKKIVHMLIKNYIIDNNKYSSLPKNSSLFFSLFSNSTKAVF